MESDTPLSCIISCPRNYYTRGFFNRLVEELKCNAKECNPKNGVYILDTTHPEIQIVIEGVMFVDNMLQLRLRREAVPLEKWSVNILALSIEITLS